MSCSLSLVGACNESTPYSLKDFGKDDYEKAEAAMNEYNTEQAAYAEVLIPRWSNLIPKDYPIEELEKEGLDIQIAYRIPTEGKQSVSVVKVVGFLDDVYGSTIMLPDELVTQTGADFDVDSVYAICHEMERQSPRFPICFGKRGY